MEKPFVETYDETVKKAVEKAFLEHDISFLIKVDKVRGMGKGLFEAKTKYSFRVNKFQLEEARAAIEEKALDNDNLTIIQ
jgi:hypothetical protein